MPIFYINCTAHLEKNASSFRKGRETLRAGDAKEIIYIDR